MKTIPGIRWCLIIFMCIGAVAPAGAAPEAERAILDRMDERLPALMDLKLAGKAGENNEGFLEARGTMERSERRLMTEENADRMALYEAIASRIGAPLKTVRVERAEDIREKSPKGVWLQSPKGEWYRK